ncbi:MAG TPA: helix-turn-helix domain-containing protein [Pirellulales bacterium]|nr:helix-turn-helix domain-containing protein [Pirellulales bacterium]
MSATTSQDQFVALVQFFAPRPIRTKKRLRTACQEIDRLMRRPKLSADERDYLELLSILVEKYEASQIPPPDVSQGEMLDHLLEAKAVTQAQVAKATGISANLLSNVRAGRRELSKENVRRLSAYFNVSPAVWL